MTEDNGRVPVPDSQPPAGGRQPSSSRPAAAVLFLIIGGLAVVLAGAFMLWQAGRGAGPGGVASSPRLAVDREQIDFGQVPYNKRVKATFVLHNEGGQPLQIVGQPRVEVVKGCWPPDAVVGSTTIDAGKSTELSLDFTMPPGMGGPHEFRVHVRSTDPLVPEKVLVVKSDWVG